MQAGALAGTEGQELAGTNSDFK